MDWSTLTLSSDGGCLVVTLNRPDKLNAINATMLNELESVFTDPQLLSDHRCIIITGAGKAFAAGADIAELQLCNATSGMVFSRHGQKVFNLIESCSLPVVAAINGYALGGGCELALACHLRFASTIAILGQPEVGLGIIPGYGGTQRLTRLIGPSYAAELIMTGEQVSAERAYGIGLVNRLYSPENLMQETFRFCRTIEQLPRQVIESALACIFSTDPSYELEAAHFGRLCSTNDFHEGVSAFIEKRRPNFQGR